MTSVARKSYAVPDVDAKTRDTAAAIKPTVSQNTLGAASAVLADMREIAEDTRLLAEDHEKYWNTSWAEFRDLDDLE